MKAGSTRTNNGHVKWHYRGLKKSLAVGTPHPMEDEAVLPDRTKKAVFNILTNGKNEWIALQTIALAAIKARGAELQNAEDKAKAKISEGLRKVRRKSS